MSDTSSSEESNLHCTQPKLRIDEDDILKDWVVVGRNQHVNSYLYIFASSLCSFRTEETI